MATGYRKLISGTRLSFNETGWTKTERIKVFGLSRAANADPLFQAISLLGKANPPIVYAGPHPIIPGVYLTNLDAEPMANSKTQAVVNLGWSDLSRVTVSIDGSVVREDTEFDAEGRPNTVLYLPPNPDNGKKRPPAGFYPEKSQKYCEASGLVSLDVLRPGMIVEFQRWRIAPTISTQYKFLEGSVNASDWQNSRPFSWLCTGVSPSGTVEVKDKNGSLAGTQTIWRERLSFQYRGFAATLGSLNNDWRKVIYYTDPRTGQSPPDIDPKADGWPQNSKGNGWRLTYPQPQTNFDFFNLPTIFVPT